MIAPLIPYAMQLSGTRANPMRAALTSTAKSLSIRLGLALIAEGDPLLFSGQLASFDAAGGTAPREAVG